MSTPENRVLNLGKFLRYFNDVEEYNEGLLVIAVYIFVATAFSLPLVIVYLFVRISTVIDRAHKLLTDVEIAEEESRKYHD